MIDMYNGTYYYDSLVWANHVTNGGFAYAWLVIVMTVVLLGTMRWGASLDRAFLVTSLVCFINVAVFTILQITNSRDFIIALFLVAFSFLWSYHS